ncbi:MAG: AraC family transcriptional regulator [Nitriliruptorales bacterium]|nr:AraC family transcriptional regulator [Nitriliruptorales bacterium]
MDQARPTAPRSAEIAMTRILGDAAGLTLGEFRGRVDDPIWDVDQSIGDAFHVVFPLTGVVIAQEGRGVATVDPRHAVIYEPGQVYRRSRVAGHADHSLFVTVDDPVLDELRWSTLGATFTARSDARMVAFLVALSRSLSDGRPVSRLELQESLMSALEAVLRAPGAEPQASAVQRPATSSAHRRLVEDVRTVLVQDITADLSLDDIASAVGYSRFHTARVFRQQTGDSIHSYRNALRLIAGVCAVTGRDVPLADIAADLGFSSHGHFTGRFTELFGAPPSVWRRALSVGELGRLRALAGI